MKLLLKFKDGMIFEADLGNDFSIKGTGNFLELIKLGKQNNRDLILNENLTRKYEDLYSFEIIL